MARTEQLLHFLLCCSVVCTRQLLGGVDPKARFGRFRSLCVEGADATVSGEAFTKLHTALKTHETAAAAPAFAAAANVDMKAVAGQVLAASPMHAIGYPGFILQFVNAPASPVAIAPASAAAAGAATSSVNSTSPAAATSKPKPAM